jgi:Zn-finger nucleic acid-binding protein
MKCPQCKDPVLVISERQGIEIDYCPDCRGIWLDRGELDKILERARAEEPRAPESAPAPAPAYQQPQGYQQPHYGHHKHYKRKKSLLEELFD